MVSSASQRGGEGRDLIMRLALGRWHKKRVGGDIFGKAHVDDGGGVGAADQAHELRGGNAVEVRHGGILESGTMDATLRLTPHGVGADPMRAKIAENRMASRGQLDGLVISRSSFSRIARG